MLKLKKKKKLRKTTEASDKEETKFRVHWIGFNFEFSQPEGGDR